MHSAIDPVPWNIRIVKADLSFAERDQRGEINVAVGYRKKHSKNLIS